MIQNFNVEWYYHNIKYNTNDIFIKDSNTITIPYGNYTFTTLKKYLGDQGVTIDKISSGRVELTSDKDLNLKKMGVLLGFPEDKAITKNTKYTSSLPANLLNWFSHINVFCSLIDESRNFDDVGNPCRLLVSVPIDTEQPLFGSITRYSLDRVVVPCRKFYGHEIEFDIFSRNTVSTDYIVRLEVCIE